MNNNTPILSLGRQRELLRLEYEAEREDFRRQTEAIGLRRKVKRGDCWFPAYAQRSYYNSLNQLVVEITRDADDAEMEHNFEYGRQVMFFVVAGNDDINYFPFTGIVSYAEGQRMVVAVPDAMATAQLQGAQRLGVQLAMDATYKLMFQALDRVMAAKNNRLAHLRDLFYGIGKPETLTFAPLRFPWLNPTQERAVNQVLLAKDVAIVHGPPGTGKTTTLVEAVYETLRRENQVLVCAQSNTAVDWISERLLDRGIDVLRVGNPTRVNDKMLSFT
ncbi:MAG: AAA family ATPase, partial [Muribaculaceae bacterium]|nr:AAA family ATPase [Muribaculaceae bacterium]